MTATDKGTRTVPVQYIDIEALEVELDCQRPLNTTRAGKMARNWDSDLAGSIHVAEYTKDDGTIGYYVLDGWTRRSAARLADVPEMLCHVHKNLTKAQRAEKFLRLNEDTVKPGKTDHHRIGVAADREDAVMIDLVLGTYGLRVSTRAGKNSVAAIKSCYDAYARGNAGDEGLALGEAVRIIQTAWDTYAGEQWKGEYIDGVARLIVKYPTLDRDRLIKVMSKITPDMCSREILDRANNSGGSSTRSLHMAAYLTERYNARLSQNRLA